MYAYLETREYSSDIPIGAFLAYNNNFLAHWHLDVEMVFVLEGQIRIGVNNHTELLGKDDMAVFSSTDIHYYDSTDLNSTIIVLIFRPDIIGFHGGWPQNYRFSSPFLFSSNNNNSPQEIRKIFTDIIREIDEQKPFFEMALKGKIFELCTIAMRNLPVYSLYESSERYNLGDINKIKNIIKYIENNYFKDISLSEICEKAGLSTYYTSKLFKKFTGINITEYIRNLRIEKAEQLLKSTNKSITEISFECGFNSIRTFNRVFKTVKGFPPSQIKKIKL